MSHRQTLRSLLLFLVLGTFFFELVLSDTFDLARQNPTLRDFFLREELRRGFYPDNYYERPRLGEIFKKHGRSLTRRHFLLKTRALDKPEKSSKNSMS